MRCSKNVSCSCLLGRYGIVVVFMNENDCFRGDCHFHSRTLENISLLGYRWVCARISVASTAAYNRSQYCAAFIRVLWVLVRLVIGVNLYFLFDL